MLTDCFLLRALLITAIGWVSREQQRAIESLIEENRILKEQLGNRRLRLSNDQRRRLPAKGKLLGRRLLGRVSTVARIVKREGIEPAPDRPSSWSAFIKATWGECAAADFFTTGVWTSRGLTTFHTLFVIDLATRRVGIAGTTRTPNEAFMAQVARNLTDVADGFPRGHRKLIVDRDTKFTRRFQELLASEGSRDDLHTAKVTELQRVRRALRALDQEGVPRPDDLLRRGFAPTRTSGVCRPLQHRASSPRARESNA